MSSQELENDVENLILNKTQDPLIDLKGKSFWIGLYKLDKVYRWLQDFSMLYPGNKVIPDSSNEYYPCVVMRYNTTNQSWSWISVNCTNFKAYTICRRIIGSKQGII